MRGTLKSRWFGLCLLTLALALNRERAGAQEPPSASATSFTGGPGITETVGQIAARDPRSGRPGAALEPVLPLDPVKTGPPAPIAPSLWPFVPTFFAGQNAPQNATPQSVGTSFVGATFADTIGFVPPDSMGAVGPSNILVIVNGRIRVFDKTGGSRVLDTTTDNFFSTVEDAGTSASDPHVRYDRLSQRWFLTMVDTAAANRVMIAVSSGPVITSGSSFTFFQFQPDANAFTDYDTLGVDANALYIGANMFNTSGTAYLDSAGFVIRKAGLLTGTLSGTIFRRMGGVNGIGPGIVTPQGVDNDDPNATEGYFIGPDNLSASALDIMRVSSPGGSPNLAGPLQVAVPTTTSPIPQVAKNTPSGGTLDALDTRLFAAAIHLNKVTGTSSLWTAHNLEVDSTGTAQSGGGRNGSRWYEINNLTGTPAVAQSGTVFDPASSNPRGYWIPSVNVSGQGHMVLGCSYASVNDFAGVAVTGRLRTDPPNSIRAPSLAVVSANAYTLNFDGNPHRWGDYSAVSVDPNDDMTMWTFQEYAYSDGTWAVQAIRLVAPPPAGSLVASPASEAHGLSSVDVVISGSASAGEFFDPGTGFSNRLGATVGGGVVVKSVTFNSPTQVTLNLDTTAATAGAQDVTIINPDGQTSTASGILTIGPSTALTCGITPATATIFADTTQTFTINASGGTPPYTYAWTNSNGAALGTGSTITVNTAGTYFCTVTDSGAPPLSASASATLTVKKATPTITWPSPAGIAYGTPLGSAQLDASASVAGTLVYSPPPGTVLPAGSGQTLSVSFTPADPATYNPATASVLIDVSRAPLTITAADKAKAYGAAVPALTAIYSGFVNGETSANLSTQPVLATTANTSSPVGAYPITVSSATAPNYTITFVSGTLNVTPAPLTIAAASKAKVYGKTNPALTVTYAGFVNGDTPASLTTPVQLTTAATTGSPVGAYAITPSGATAHNYNITFVNGTLSVTPAALKITAVNKSKTYGKPLPVFTASYSGFVNGDTVANLATPPVFSTTAAASSPVGTYPISVSGASGLNYTITFVSGVLTVTHASLTITAQSKSKTYGAAVPALTASYSGFVNGDTSANLDTQPTLATAVTQSSPAGTYVITVSGAAASNYVIKFVNGTLTVKPAPLSVKAANQSKVYGAALPSLTYTITGFVLGETEAVLSSPVVIGTPATASSPVSAYPVTVSGATAANYTISFVNATLTVTKAPLTITADNKIKAVGDPVPPLTYTITGFVNGDTEAGLATPVSISTTATQSSPAGAYPITVGGATAANYTISFVKGTLTVQ